MILDLLREQKTLIETLAAEFGARRIRVFGSVARGEETPESDIDLLVDFPKGYDLFRQRIPLTDKLNELLGREVELIPEHELNAHIRDNILAEAIEL